MKNMVIVSVMALFCAAAVAAQTPSERTWGVCIGISAYDDVNLTLKWSDTDANDFCKTFLKYTLNIPEDQYTFVKNEDATHDGILNAFGWVAMRARPGDRVYLFYSGHGSDGALFVPYDSGYPLTLDEVRSALSKIDADEVLVFTDACLSGRLAGKRTKAATGKGGGGWSKKMAVKLAQSVTSGVAKGERGGVVIMTSSNGQQDSLEIASLKNSLFTYHLMHHLMNPAGTDADKDGRVTLYELYKAVYDAVTSDAEQQPQISNKQAAQAVTLFVYQKPTPVPSPPTPEPTITPISLPQTAMLTVRSNVYGDTVFINGKNYGSSRVDVELPLGQYKIRVEKPDCDSFEESVNLRQAYTLHVQLQCVDPTPTPQQESAAGTVWYDPVADMEFVWIPSGSFQMGCVSGIDCSSDEKPVHRVTLDGFWMGRTEVTQAQWQRIMGNNPSGFKGDNNPVEKVSWNDAQTFISQLNRKAGPTLYRLPTEAEWEYAARAGTQTMYSFGSDSSRSGDYAWYWNNSDKKTHPVGQKLPNSWGLYDMHGNIWEWCQDWYGEYSANPQTNPTGYSGGSERVLRGGSWLYESRYVRSAYRRFNAPSYRYDYVGLRLVRNK